MVVAYEGYCKIFRVGIVEVAVCNQSYFTFKCFQIAISILENIIDIWKLWSFYGNELYLDDVNGSWRMKLFEIVLVISWVSKIESEYNKLNFILIIKFNCY